MSRLPVEYWREGELYWAKYVSGESRPIRESWAGLFDEAAIDEIDAAHWHRFAINNNNREEIAVYLRVIWALLSDREILGNAYYWTEDASKELTQPGSVARWHFEVDGQGPPEYAVVKGFTPARSAVQIRPAPSESQRAMREKTLWFRVTRYSELVGLLRSVLSDTAGEISLFGTSELRAHAIVDVLRGESQPHIGTLLYGDELFAHLGIGVDYPGYNDFIFVASRRPLKPLLDPIVQDAERAIVEYESRVNRFSSPREALALLEALAGPGSIDVAT